MLRWSLLLISICLVAGSLIPSFKRQSGRNRATTSGSEGPRRPGAFVTPNGDTVIIEAGDTGSYPTGMYDSTIDYKNDVKFFLYTRNNPDNGQQLFLNNQSSIIQSNFNPFLLTKFIIHGFENNLRSPMIQLNKKAFLANDNFNVIAVDWSPLATDILYPIVVSEVPGVGNYVGEFINFLISSASIDESQIHLIGHSLGAHVSGFAGKYVQTLGFNLSRISGLDPALPGYPAHDPSKRLADTDADFVDCVHTCAGVLGFLSPICQADYYPNGGTPPQPGCSVIDLGACSHGKSFKYYASSINSSNVFSAKICKKMVLGIFLGCSADGAQMGYPATDKYQGEFYLKTTADYPYAE